ncbi:MAG: hypothetical protein QOE69_1205 [Thermoleophilaceae bacterium]|nr:hypothetical protein [Thermoleophilaceae bacterium]MEA2407086.1 hypothetical protein [Thermoleophilaceae bacterium]
MSRRRPGDYWKAAGATVSALAALVAVIAYFVPGPGSKTDKAASTGAPSGTSAPSDDPRIVAARLQEPIALGDYVASSGSVAAVPNGADGTTVPVALILAQAAEPSGDASQPPADSQLDTQAAPDSSGTESEDGDTGTAPETGTSDGSPSGDGSPGGIDGGPRPPTVEPTESPEAAPISESGSQLAGPQGINLLAQTSTMADEDPDAIAALPADLAAKLDNPDEAKRVMGSLFDVYVNLAGRSEPKLRLHWRVFRKTPAGPVRLDNPFFKDAMQRTFPTPPKLANATLQAWAPWPRGPGAYLVRFTLTDTDDNVLGQKVDRPLPRAALP